MKEKEIKNKIKETIAHLLFMLRRISYPCFNHCLINKHN